MKKLLKYDFYHLQKTSKFIVFPIVIVLFAIISPLTARYMNEILSFALGQSGIDIPLPDTSVLDSYVQYIGNLIETVLYVVIFVGIGFFIRDKTKGLLPLILSKPINRTKYIISKYISLNILILVSLFIGLLVFSYYTYYIFDEVDLIGMFYVTLLFFVYVLFTLSICLFTSTFFKSYIVSVMVTFGIYIVISLIAMVKISIFIYLPGALTNNMIAILVDTVDSADLILNVLVSLAISAGFVFLSIFKFKTQDL